MNDLNQRCKSWLEEALNDPEINAMIPPDVKIECKPCNYQGYFDNTSRTITLCEENLFLPFIFKQALKHEAVHAWDSKYKSLFKNPCDFRACTEIRAAAFSNECSIMNEFLRLNFPNFKKCVKRKAQLSTDMDPQCSGSVDKMWDKCFNSDLDSNISKFQ